MVLFLCVYVCVYDVAGVEQLLFKVDFSFYFFIMLGNFLANLARENKLLLEFFCLQPLQCPAWDIRGRKKPK